MRGESAQPLTSRADVGAGGAQRARGGSCWQRQDVKRCEANQHSRSPVEPMKEPAEHSVHAQAPVGSDKMLTSMRGESAQPLTSRADVGAGGAQRARGGSCRQRQDVNIDARRISTAAHQQSRCRSPEGIICSRTHLWEAGQGCL